MRKLVLALTLLITSTATMAAGDAKKAVKAIETVFIMKVKEELNPLVKPAINKISQRLKNRYGNDGKPSATVKSLGAAVKGLTELVQPDYTHKTETSETRFRLLQFKTLKIDF